MVYRVDILITLTLSRGYPYIRRKDIMKTWTLEIIFFVVKEIQVNNVYQENKRELMEIRRE